MIPTIHFYIFDFEELKYEVETKKREKRVFCLFLAGPAVFAVLNLLWSAEPALRGSGIFRGGEPLSGAAARPAYCRNYGREVYEQL